MLPLIFCVLLWWWWGWWWGWFIIGTTQAAMRVKNCCEGVGWWRLQWLQHNWSNVCELVARSEVIPSVECEGLQESKCTVQQYQFGIFCLFFLKAQKIHPVEHGKAKWTMVHSCENVKNSKFAQTHRCSCAYLYFRRFLIFLCKIAKCAKCAKPTVGCVSCADRGGCCVMPLITQDPRVSKFNNSWSSTWWWWGWLAWWWWWWARVEREDGDRQSSELKSM